MKKMKLSKIIKRSVLVLLLVLVIVVAGVYFIDQYKPSKLNANNAYPNGYFDGEKLEGFTYYDELKEKIAPYDVSSPSYKAPWEADGFDKAGSSLTEIEKMQYARYKEELDRIYAPSQTKLRQLTNQVRDIEKYIFPNSEVADISQWGEVFLGYAEYDVEGTETTFTSLYAYAQSLGYTGTKEALFKEIKYCEEAGDPFTAFELLINDSFEYEEFAYLCFKDSEFSSFVFSKDAEYEAECDYVNILNEKIEYEQIQNYYRSVEEDYVSWSYYSETQIFELVLTKEDGKGNKFEFWFNPILTSFKLLLVDGSGNVLQEWLSNPSSEDPNFTGSSITIDQKSQLNIHYQFFGGTPGSASNYEFSTSSKNPRKLSEALTPDYAIKYDAENDKVLVYYHLSKRGVTYADFPRYITKERFEEIINRNPLFAAVWNSKNNTELDANIKILNDSLSAENKLSKTDVQLFKSVYGELIKLDDPTNEYAFKGYEYYEIDAYGTKMGEQSVKVCNTVLYKICNYTEEDLERDNSDFDQFVETSDPEFSIALEYKLTSKGLEVMIPGNSVKDTEAYPLTYVEILPYFTSTKQGIEGYTVIPDGSGAVMQHDNGNTQYASYSKRVYTKDLSFTDLVNPGTSEELLLPMYGVINEGNTSGMLTYATDGASLLQLNADISGRKDSYNKNYFTAYYRESIVITVGRASYERKELTKWTNAKQSQDLKLNFEVLYEDELNYSKLANRYREALIDMYGLTINDTTTSPTLDMDVLGTYSYTENFVGIPYTNYKTLTTYEQLNKMIEDFQKVGVENINAFYKGWRKEGLVDTSFKKIKLSKLNGSKAQFEELFKQEDSVNIYPYVSFGEINKFQESFGSVHYVSHNVAGEFSKRYPYDFSSNVFDTTKPVINALSPLYYVKFAETLTKNYTKVAPFAETLAVEKLGSALSGDYKKGIETFKEDAIAAQIESLNKITASVPNLTLYSPYDYAFKYTSIAKSIPFETTRYEIIDYSIPFYQLVVNGMFDYSGVSFNSISEKGANEYIMRLIETGSNMAYTFSYDSSEDLIQTDYNMYYYTRYTDWVEDVKGMYEELNNLGIYNGRLVAHERIANEVFKVTYEGKQGMIEIYLNYNRSKVTLSDGTVVPAKSYVVK